MTITKLIEKNNRELVAGRRFQSNSKAHCWRKGYYELKDEMAMTKYNIKFNMIVARKSNQ